MAPLIGPIGLDYVAASAEKAGIDVEVVDLGLADQPEQAVKDYFSTREPELVGLSFRNADDCFWPSADWFVPGLKDTIRSIRSMTNAPIVIGGVGFSIFAEPIVEYTGADFGIAGDGETAITALIRQLQATRRFEEVPGLTWRENGKIHNNPPSWPNSIQFHWLLPAISLIIGAISSGADNVDWKPNGAAIASVYTVPTHCRKELLCDCEILPKSLMRSSHCYRRESTYCIFATPSSTCPETTLMQSVKNLTGALWETRFDGMHIYHHYRSTQIWPKRWHGPDAPE